MRMVPPSALWTSAADRRGDHQSCMLTSTQLSSYGCARMRKIDIAGIQAAYTGRQLRSTKEEM
jgi:hypothetical protein